VTFDGIAVEAMVARNKMGGTGHSARLNALIDSIEPGFAFTPSIKSRDEKSIVEKPALRIGLRGERR
jgi:hypothetical protein